MNEMHYGCGCANCMSIKSALQEQSEEIQQSGWLSPSEAEGLRRRAETAVAELDRLHSWDGLMELLNEHYPIDVIQDSSGDEGPRICALIRNIDDLRDALATATDLLHEQAKALRQAREAFGAVMSDAIDDYYYQHDCDGILERARAAISAIDAILNKEHAE